MDCRFRDRFGTISGFRLGRWKEEVKWPEVNTGWGQAVLLLDMMTRMYPDFKWEQGMLKPMGSHSMVCVLCNIPGFMRSSRVGVTCDTWSMSIIYIIDATSRKSCCMLCADVRLF